jgi:hypothetical protein
MTPACATGNGGSAKLRKSLQSICAGEGSYLFTFNNLESVVCGTAIAILQAFFSRCAEER